MIWSNGLAKTQKILKYFCSFFDLKTTLFFRYDNVGMHGNSKKIDPTLKKSFTADELGNQLLFASANGDLAYLRRYQQKCQYLCVVYVSFNAGPT